MRHRPVGLGVQGLADAFLPPGRKDGELPVFCSVFGGVGEPWERSTVAGTEILSCDLESLHLA